MKCQQIVSIALSLILFIAGIIPAPSFAQPAVIPTEVKFVEGEALVLFTEDPTEPNSVETNSISTDILTSENAPEAIMQARLQTSEKGYSVTPLVLFDKSAVQTHSYADGVSDEKIAIGIVRSETATTEELIADLQKNKAVAHAQPNYLYEIIEPVIEESDIAYPDAENMENATRLYGIFNNANNAGVRADKVWTQGFTGQNVVIADIDTGADISHADLSGNIWQNRNETDCDNRRDDDNNGYIDDCRGWDFMENDNNPSPAHAHGTHTSGTALGMRNSDGIVGVAPDAKLMVVKIGGASGIPTSAIVAGIDYAVKNGADVINLSLGGGIQCPKIEQDVVQKAKAARVFIAVSSGNFGKNTSTAPANCPDTFGVGATDARKALASFSSYSGDLVDGVGPGVNILSSVPRSGFQVMSGTSMASPAIAGIAALMLSKNPNLTPQQITDIMCQTAEDLGPAGKDEQFGCGFVSAEKAVAAVTNSTSTPAPTPTPPGGVNACHRITKMQDLAGSTSFGLPFNPFDLSEMLMTAQCVGTQATVTAGSTKTTPYIFRQGYVFAGGQWNPFLYNGANAASADWFTGTASANLSQVYNPQSATFFLAYICLRVSNQWKCGCSDQACASPKWNLQAFQ